MKYLLAAFLFILPAVAQTMGQLSLAGSVINSRTGEPITRALITINRLVRYDATTPRPLSPPPLVNRTMFTDSGGSFRFTGLPEGDYSVRVQKPEFTLESVPGGGVGMPIKLTASVEGIVKKLSPLGVISGTVTDQDGLPLPGVKIIVLSVQIQDGLRQVKSDRNVATDDRGVYRFWNLGPGKYYVKAEGGGAGSFEFVGDASPGFGDESFALVYFGGTHSLDSATPIEIVPGSDARADFALKMERAFRVIGSIANFVPRHAINVELLSGTEDASSTRVGVNAETGKFVLGTVVPGSYVLHATQDTFTAEMPITVKSADLEGVSLTLMPPVDVPAKVRFTNTPPPVASDPERSPAGGCIPSMRAVGNPAVRPNWSGRPDDETDPGGVISGVSPGKYLATVECFSAYARSMTAGSQDLAANPILTIAPGVSPPPIEIVATHGGGQIKGKVVIAGVKDATILLVPQFSSPVGPQTTVAFSQATDPGELPFGFDGLAPGSYTVRAFSNGDIEFRNPEFLRRLSGGTIVQIDGDGEKELTITELAR